MNVRIPLILASLCVAGGASAQVNLLPLGSFENPGIDTGWAEGFRIPNNQEFQVVSERGKHWLRIENRDAGRQLDYVHAYVKVTAQIASLTVSARMRATNLKIGKEGWHTARVALMFEGGSSGFPPQVPELRADSDWVTKSVELKVPEGATRLNIQPAMFRCTGVFEVADLTVTPRLAAPTQPGDAVLPAGIALNWDKTGIEAVNARRARRSGRMACWAARRWERAWRSSVRWTRSASTRTRRLISFTRDGGPPAPSPSSSPTWAPAFRPTTGYSIPFP